MLVLVLVPEQESVLELEPEPGLELVPELGLVEEVVRLLEYLMLVHLAVGEFHQRLGVEEV